MLILPDSDLRADLTVRGVWQQHWYPVLQILQHRRNGMAVIIIVTLLPFGLSVDSFLHHKGKTNYELFGISSGHGMEKGLFVVAGLYGGGVRMNPLF